MWRGYKKPVGSKDAMNAELQNENELLSAEQAAAKLKVSKKTVLKMGKGA